MALSIFFLLLLLFQSSTKVSSQKLTRSFPAILVFGDSTADSGNNNYLQTTTILKANHLPYGQDYPGKVSTGRFSNGKLVPDFLASLLGIKDSVPPFLEPNIPDEDILTGVNFASAGSGFDDLTANISQVIRFPTQISHFKDYLKKLKELVGEKQAKRTVESAFVILSAGTNDFAINFYDTPARTQSFNLHSYQDFILNKLHGFINVLYGLGCRTIMITGLPPMGCLPVQITLEKQKIVTNLIAGFLFGPEARTCIQEQNAAALAYNKKLKFLLHKIQSSLNGSKIMYADIYQPMMDMIENPLKHGFTETKVGCCGTGVIETGLFCLPFSPICENASSYLFFDVIHPSEAAYRHVTKSIWIQIHHQL